MKKLKNSENEKRQSRTQFKTKEKLNKIESCKNSNFFAKLNYWKS